MLKYVLYRSAFLAFFMAGCVVHSNHQAFDDCTKNCEEITAESEMLKNQTPVTLGVLDKSIIRKTIRRAAPATRFCYEKELAKNPSLQGQVSMQFLIDSNGAVSKVSFLNSLQDSVENCLTQVFTKLHFPKSREDVEVIYVYRFLPTDKEKRKPGEDSSIENFVQKTNAPVFYTFVPEVLVGDENSAKILTANTWKAASDQYSQGKFQESIKTFQHLIEREEDIEKRFLYQYEICMAALSLTSFGDYKTLFNETETLLAFYGEMKIRNYTEEAREKAKQEIKGFLLEIVLNLHETAHKLNNILLYKRAEALYQYYFYLNHENTETHYKMTWNYAELLFRLAEFGERSKWKESSKAYQQVVKMKPNGRFKEEAKNAYLIAQENASKFDDSK